MSRFKGGAATCPIDDSFWPAWPRYHCTPRRVPTRRVPNRRRAASPARGSVGKTPLNDLVDAYSQVSGVDWQHQLYSTLSNRPGVCARYRQNQVLANEKWLLVIQTAYRADQQPAPFATGTYGIGVGTTGPDGTLRTADATFQPFGRNCSAGGQQEATGGTVTYTVVTDTLVRQLRPAVRQEPGHGQLLGPDVHPSAPRPDVADVPAVVDAQPPGRSERPGGCVERTDRSGSGPALPVGLGPVVGPVADGRPGGPAVAVAALEVDAAIAARHAGLVGGVEEAPPLEDHVPGRARWSPVRTVIRPS